MRKLPAEFQRLLWSYDMKKMDADRNKDEVITQVLNYGSWIDVKLLEQMYSEKDIRDVIAAPQRGVWFEKVLNFWTIVLGIKLTREKFRQAVIRINEIPVAFKPGRKKIR